MNILSIRNIHTNNLKNINIDIPYNKLIAISGISGGGKSSLAYNTIYALCHQEFKSLENGYFEDTIYKIDKATGILPAVAIKQINSNINPRSTIYSYLNVSSIFSSSVSSQGMKVDIHLLKLNNPNNSCKQCDGLGEINSIDERKVINYNIPLAENPFIPWVKGNSNKNINLLIAYCKHNKIDITKTLPQLRIKQQDNLLNIKDGAIYSISFKHNNKARKRNLQYVGILTELNSYLHSKKASERKLAEAFCIKTTCPSCNGSRLNKERYLKAKILDIKFPLFFELTIHKLLKNMMRKSAKTKDFDRLIGVLKTIDDIGLGYLKLSRSIPSLSGGELQKLNFCKLLTSDISNIAIIIDEISAQLHVSDYRIIADGIRSIKKRGNTIILVEHSQYFVDLCDRVITIGPKAGDLGGYITSGKKIKKLTISKPVSQNTELIQFDSITKNNVSNLTLKVPRDSVTAIVGKSGSGKSSVAEYIAEHYPDVRYISQASIKGNIRSTVATYLGINKKIALWYSKEFDKDYSLFLPSSGSKGACQGCSGTGINRYERTFESAIDVTCTTCNGRLFSNKVDVYTVEGETITDLYATSLDYFTEKLGMIKSLVQVASVANNLGLGHLSLNRKTQTLSGGELRRLKLLKELSKNKKSDKILLIDEPGSGLDDDTASKVMGFINSQASMFQAIIVIDHKPVIFLPSDYLIELGPGSGDMGGKIVYEGCPYNYYKRLYKN